MDAILQVSETVGLKFPEHFAVFLDNCIQEFQDSFLPYDYLFAMIYFIILESGFSPTDFFNEHPELCTQHFNIKKMHLIKCYKKDYVKTWKGLRDGRMMYKIPVRYGAYKTECEIQAVPSIKDPNYLIVNMLKRRTITTKSLSIRLDHFLKKNSADDPDSKYKFTFTNIKELDFFIKSEICSPTREAIMIQEDPGSGTNLLGLPETVKSEIMHELCDNSTALLSLSSTCSYFLNHLKSNSSVWLKLCLKYYGTRAVQRLILEYFQYGTDDSSMFKQIFLELTKRKQKNLSTSYMTW